MGTVLVTLQKKLARFLAIMGLARPFFVASDPNKKVPLSENRIDFSKWGWKNEKSGDQQKLMVPDVEIKKHKNIRKLSYHFSVF